MERYARLRVKMVKGSLDTCTGGRANYLSNEFVR